MVDCYMWTEQLKLARLSNLDCTGMQIWLYKDGRRDRKWNI